MPAAPASLRPSRTAIRGTCAQPTRTRCAARNLWSRPATLPFCAWRLPDLDADGASTLAFGTRTAERSAQHLLMRSNWPELHMQRRNRSLAA